MQPATPPGFHTTQEPDATGRLPRRDFLDEAAQHVAVFEKPPPPVVVGGKELVDGSVPRRFGPAEEPDADGWVLGGDLAELQLLPAGRVAVRPAFIAPARPDAAQLDALPSGSRLTEDIRAGLAASPTVNRYHTLRTAARSWPALREGAPADPGWR
jgi:hypothetical protein